MAESFIFYRLDNLQIRYHVRQVFNQSNDSL